MTCISGCKYEILIFDVKIDTVIVAPQTADHVTFEKPVKGNAL